MLESLWVRNLEVDQLGASGSGSLMRSHQGDSWDSLTGAEEHFQDGSLPRLLAAVGVLTT